MKLLRLIDFLRDRLKTVVRVGIAVLVLLVLLDAVPAAEFGPRVIASRDPQTVARAPVYGQGLSAPKRPGRVVHQEGERGPSGSSRSLRH